MRRRRHAAASARILSAGLSAGTAFGIVGAMAVTAGAHEPSVPAALRADTDPVPAAPADVVVVIRRHWGAAGPADPAPLLVTTPARPASVAGAEPAPAPAAPRQLRPVTRTRGS
jgi:hypothetical protein